MVSLKLFRFRAGRLLPRGLLEQVRMHRRRRAAEARKRERADRIARDGTLDADALAGMLREAGVRTGGVLFVQTSFNDLFTFTGRPADLLRALRSVVGADGTLLMPAYTEDRPLTPAAPLDIDALPTYTGIVNELFRRSPGVRRSLHPRHSLCAEGPLAEPLLAGHQECLYADGPGSPLDRLRAFADAQILTLGLPAAFTSFLHWIEDIEPDKLPFAVHEAAPKRYCIHHTDGPVHSVSDMQVRPEIAARLDLDRVARALTAPAMSHGRRRGLDVGVYHVPSLAVQLLALRDRGLIHYR